jgi:hypothetical protein
MVSGCILDKFQNCYYATEDNSEFSEGKGKGERRENSKERTHHITQQASCLNLNKCDYAASLM